MKHLLFCCCLFLYSLQAFSQSSTFAKSLFEIDNSQRVRVIPTNDLGWFEFSLDSLKIYKFNSCGNLLWAQHYSLPGISASGVDIIPTPSGGFAFLVMNYPGNVYALIVSADADGNILWSKSFEDVQYSEVPYTLIQDVSGNFYIYGNVTFTATLSVYNSLTKISNSGSVIWSKLYDHGGTWGGATYTQDGGFLLRTGSVFIKTDANGNELWTSFFNAPINNYYKAVEVNDGYIFNSNNHSFGGGDTISFYKMDKNGMAQWGGRKQINFKGDTKNLCQKTNGNFIFLHQKSTALTTYSTWTEFDKDLNVVNQSATTKLSFTNSFSESDICFLADNTAVVGGRVTIFQPALYRHMGFVKVDSNQHFGCDTSLAVTSILKPITQSLLSTSTTARIFTSTDHFILSQTRLDSTYTLCSNLSALQVNIGNDTLVCDGSVLIVSNSSNDYFDSFLWSTGEITSTIHITQAGKYWLRAYNSCRKEFASDTLDVKFSVFPFPKIVTDTSICSMTPIVLNAEITNGTYLWQDGSTEAMYNASLPGVYSVTITYLNCSKHFESTISDCESLILPNVITPNSDAVNNAFLPIEMKGILTAQLKIFNRWGQEIFATSDILNRPWKGRTYSKDCSDGVYFWTVEYSNYQHQFKVQKGTVTLVRN